MNTNNFDVTEAANLIAQIDLIEPEDRRRSCPGTLNRLYNCDITGYGTSDKNINSVFIYGNFKGMTRSVGNRETEEQDGASLHDRILSRGNLNKAHKRVKVRIRGWLGCFGIAIMNTAMQRWDEWLRRRYSCYIRKQWKIPRTRAQSLMKLGTPEWQVRSVSNCRKACWHVVRNAPAHGKKRSGTW